MSLTTATVGPLILDSGRRSFAYRKNLEEFMIEFIQKSLQRRKPFEPIITEVYSNYTVAPLFPAPTFRESEEERQYREQSMIKDPETHQVIESLTAQSIGLLLGVRDYLQAIPFLRPDPDLARFLSRILMGVLETPGTYRTLYEEIKNAYLYGTAYLELGYDKRARKQVVLEPVFDEQSGISTGRRFQLRNVMFQDGPAVRGIDWWDAYPDPDGTRIQSSRGFAKRFRFDKAEFKFLARRGTLNVKEGVREIMRRIEGNETGVSDAGSEDEAQNIGGLSRKDRLLEMRVTVNRRGKMVGFEYHGHIPFKTPDGANHRVVGMLGGEIVRDHPIPWIDGNIPFKELITNPVAGRHYGLGAAEVIRFLQDSTDNFLMILTDAANQALKPTLMAGLGFQADYTRLRRRLPGDVIDVMGNLDQLRPVPNDLGALQYGIAELLRRKATMREGVGATSPLQAIPAGDRTTATEANLLFSVATQRVGASTSLMERDDFPWLGRGILSRLRQFTPPGLERVATFEGQAIPFTLEDIDFESDVRFVGTRLAKSKESILQATQIVIQTLGAAPELLFLIPQVMVRMMRDGLEMDDAEKIAEEAKQNFLQMRQLDAQLRTQGGAGGQQSQ